jgi:predicted RNA binding protein YcfA (HicA-like mRNA interferase family)
VTRRDKLIARIRARPPEADFNDVRAVLEAFGYHDRGGKGSHHVFVKEGSPPVTVPTVGGRRVKRHYLDKLCELLELDEME